MGKDAHILVFSLFFYEFAQVAQLTSEWLRKRNRYSDIYLLRHPVCVICSTFAIFNAVVSLT